MPRIKYITPEEAAAIVGVDDSTIRRWAKKNKIKGAIQVGDGKRSTWLIPKHAIEGLERDGRGLKPPQK
jgi:excisionase family DNA binding protein